MPTESVATKHCLTCGRSLRADAVRCRYCLRDVREAPLDADLEPGAAAPDGGGALSRTGGSTRRRRIIAAAAGLLLVALFAVSSSTPRPLAASTTISVVAGSPTWPMANGDLGAARSTAAAAALGGEIAWSHDFGVEVSAPPVADAERLYVGLVDDRLVALDVRDGRELWTFEAPPALKSAPTLAGGRLYLLLTGGQLIALDAETGTIVWRAGSEGTFFVSPAVADGVLYAFGSGELFGFDAADGRELWRADTGATLAAVAPIVDQRFVVVAAGRRVRVYDRDSGERTFEHPHRDVAGVIFGEGRVFSISPPFAAAFDPASEEPWWESLRGARNQLWVLGVAPRPARPAVEWINNEAPLTLEDLRGAVTEVFAPAYDGIRLVAATTDGLVRAYAGDSGETLWELQLDRVAGPPTFVAGGLLLTTGEGLSLRDPATGGELAALALPAADGRSVIVTDSGTYIADRSGLVQALRGP